MLNRWRPGVAGLQSRQRTQERYAEVSEAYLQEQYAALERQFATFRTSLERFARTHRERIQRDPELRAHFHVMCANLGVEPYVSRRTFWSELFGFGEWYARLGLLVAQTAMATRSINGGLIPLSILQRVVTRAMGHGVDRPQSASASAPLHLSEDDIARAVRTLAPLKAGFRIVQSGDGDKFLMHGGALDAGFSADQLALLDRAREQGGYVRREDWANAWPDVRWERCIRALLDAGIVWVDDGHADRKRGYWVLGLLGTPPAPAAAS